MLEQPPRFGPELRRLRLEAGLTLARLSELVHYSKGQLSKVERGLKPPSTELARLCDAVLQTGGTLSPLVPERSSHTPCVELPEAAEEGEVWLMQLSADGTNWFQPVGRRQFIAVGTASAVRLSIDAPYAHGEEAPLLESARSLFDSYRRLGQSTSPALVLPPLIAQTHTLRDLAARTGRAREGLLTLASRYAEYVGWLVQETGNDQAALWWTERAVELAEAGGDHDLAAYALVRRALTTLYREDATQTIALAEQAQHDGLPPRIRGLAAQREAQGHALAGDYDACMRCLDRARALLSQSATETSEPVIGTTNLADSVSMITGWCLHDLGQPQQASALIDREIARIPPHAWRSRARYGIRNALAHATAGEIDHACALAHELIDAADAVGSATIRADLRRLARTLARHPRNPSVRKLSPRLAASLHSTAP